MKKLKAFIDIATLVSAILLVIVLGALMYTLTDSVAINTSRNGSGAIGAMLTLIPLLVLVAVVVSLVKFGTE